MFILRQDQFNDDDLQNAGQFVDFWSKFYSEEKMKEYKEELNLGSELTDQDIKQWLRWKDPQRLSNTDKENEYVARVIKIRDSINGFRSGKMSEDKFKEEAFCIFPSGLVWPIFLFHIARPFEYPIADWYVFHAFASQRGAMHPRNWDGYEEYKDNYFFKLAKSAKIIGKRPKGNETNIEEIVVALKMVDNALFTFGRFLYLYDKQG